jgi:acyl transferase domain-containing protein
MHDDGRQDNRQDKIAVVGCGLRLPGDIDSLDALWRFLVAGGDAIRDLPDNRWVNDLYDPQPRAGRTYVRRAGYLSGLELDFNGLRLRVVTERTPLPVLQERLP